jgi:ribosomal protein S27AE
VILRNVFKVCGVLMATENKKMQKQKSNDMCKCCNIPMKQHSEGINIRYWYCPVCGYKQYVTKFDKEGTKE